MTSDQGIPAQNPPPPAPPSPATPSARFVAAPAVGTTREAMPLAEALATRPPARSRCQRLGWNAGGALGERVWWCFFGRWRRMCVYVCPFLLESLQAIQAQLSEERKTLHTSL